MEANTKQNFISVDKKTAMSSYGEFFSVGETVRHDDANAGTATIVSFEPEVDKNEVKVITDKGHTHIDFINKTK
jgi:hypothetical protein